MSSLRKLEKLAALGLLLVLGCFSVETELRGAPFASPREWRIWTSPDGIQVEAYLKNVHPSGVVIVRRDGRQFFTPLEYFSAGDQRYVTEWAEQYLPNAENFRALEPSYFEIPERDEIENVEHYRPGPGE